MSNVLGELDLSTSPFSLHADSGYVELYAGERYILEYYTVGKRSRRRFKGVVYTGYDIVRNHLVFVTPRGSRVSIKEENIITCVQGR